MDPIRAQNVFFRNPCIKNPGVHMGAFFYYPGYGFGNNPPGPPPPPTCRCINIYIYKYPLGPMGPRAHLNLCQVFKKYESPDTFM